MTYRTILALDQGTTNTKALLVDEAGRIVASASSPLTQSYPHPAWVEQDPLAIWESVQNAMGACLQQAGAEATAGLAAVAVTNQRETVTAWERHTGKPLGPAISWQCHRTADFCSTLKAGGVEPLLRERTGLTIDPMFSGSKARWLLEHIADGRARARRGGVCIGTMDSWVLWNLTGGAVHACDDTNASRTQLFNLHQRAWDDELLRLFGVPRAALPEVKPSGSIYGSTIPLGRLPGGLPIASLIGDSHAALFGHARPEVGAVKATYGTGSSLMSPTRSVVNSEHGISATIAWSRTRDDGAPQVTYALEGNIYATGAAVQWLGELLGLADAGRGVEELATRVADTGGVYLVPAFGGLGAPHWNDTARALFCGMTRGTQAAHLARAALEAIAYQVGDVFSIMEAEAGTSLRVLLADGGASRDNLLMQFQADILGRAVLRSASTDLSALGAAYLAGLTVGLWASEAEVAGLAQPSDRFEPNMSGTQREGLLSGWRDALARALLEVR